MSARAYYALSWFLGEGREQEMECEAYPYVGQEVWPDLPCRERWCETWPEGVRFVARGRRVQDVPFCDLMHHGWDGPPWRRQPGELRELMCRVRYWLLFSERLKEAVEQAGLVGCRFYPAVVEVPWEGASRRYWYAHAVWLDGALDLARSRYEEVGMPGLGRRGFSVFEYVLRRGALGEADLFRVAEAPGCVFCSGRFRELFAQGGYSGLGFSPVAVTD